MTLREQMESDVSSVFLNTDEHAETVTYTPKNGTARSVTVIIDEDGSLTDLDGNRIGKNVAQVFAERSESGIPTPALGDTIALTRNGISFLLSYAGIFTDADEFGWWLTFNVSRTERISGNVGQA